MASSSYSGAKRIRYEQTQDLLRSSATDEQLPVTESLLDKDLLGNLPEGILLFIISKLSWDQIMSIASIWKKLCQLSRDQSFFEEYAQARAQKPICLLNVYNPLPWHHIRSLSYEMLAGDHQDHNLGGLLISRPKFFTIAVPDTALFTQPYSIQNLHTTLDAAGCFILLRNHGLGTFQHEKKKFDLFLVMNPLNGIAKTVSPTEHARDVDLVFNGFFKDDDLGYQILVSHCDTHSGKHTVVDEDIVDLFDSRDLNEIRCRRLTCHLYESSTHSWSTLFKGYILKRYSGFTSPVLFDGVLHALFLMDLSARSGPGANLTYHVGKIFEGKWKLLEASKPSPTLLFPHLFTFQGMLMLAGGVPSTGFRPLESVCVWKLHESNTWVEVQQMPSSLFREFKKLLKGLGKQWFPSCSSNGDYLMIVPKKIHLDVSYPRKIFCNLLTGQWQLMSTGIRSCPLGGCCVNSSTSSQCLTSSDGTLERPATPSVLHQYLNSSDGTQESRSSLRTPRQFSPRWAIMFEPRFDKSA